MINWNSGGSLATSSTQINRKTTRSFSSTEIILFYVGTWRYLAFELIGAFVYEVIQG